MLTRKFLLLAASAAIAVGACSSSGATTAPTTKPSTAASAPASAGGSAAAGGCVVGVSWNNFQQPRWAAHDEPALKGTIEAGGGSYIRADANLNAEQQLTDIDTMISKGAKVLIILAQDGKAILPALKKAADAGIPVIGYDRLLEDPGILYMSFDNVNVGQAEATAIINKVPKGNYVLIKGDPGDANAKTFLPQGWDLAGLKAKVDSKDIVILNGPDGTFTDGWKTEKAQANMEAIIDKAVADGTKIDAILAENDSTALGVVGALTAKNYGFPPLSGQDGDAANLNNVALGKQYVDVWKNANELGKAAGYVALQLCNGAKIPDVKLPADKIDPTVFPTGGPSPLDFKTPGGVTEKSLIMNVTPLTADLLQKPIDAGYVTKDQVCKGVDAAKAPPACK